MPGRTIVTAEEMRSAEASAIAAGTSVETLMDRAGTAAAEVVRRHAGALGTLVLCGPGNNGGDGYVVARRLRERGIDVRVAALGEPRSDACKWARSGWGGEVAPLGEAEGAPVLVDALFGTGLTRPLDPPAADALMRLAGEAQVRVAIDLPSGAATDDGRLLSPVPDYELTVTFAALKPSHLLQPCARHLGRVIVADIGIETASRLHEIGRPRLAAPGPDDHKYSRGYVAVLAGDMPGAASLGASAALRAGAGYVRLVADRISGAVPMAVVQGSGDPELLRDVRIGAILVGPGLGRDDDAGQLLDQALDAGRPLILDADALVLLAGRLDRLRELPSLPILTPHEGEFARLFPDVGGDKLARARAAAQRANAVIVLKGPDTVVAAPDGAAAISPPAPSWLATAGTGDVLAGIIAALRARGLAPFEAACAAVWLHGRAARRVGPALIADDLVAALPSALIECL
ncbi:MAG: NAD(P)H-hydrate dehydratase [Sphingomonadales bacterium]